MGRKQFKVGIFGASFNPLHLGHLNLLVQIQEQFNFNLIKVIPAYQSPFHPPLNEVSSQKRFNIVQEVFKDYSFVEVDPQEINREGISYTVDTIEAIKQNPSASKEIFLIIGIDQFAKFDKWKDFRRIIEMGNLLVCSRPGYEWNSSIIPQGLKKLIRFDKSRFDKSRKEFPQKLLLTTGKNIFFHLLNNMDISSSQVRQRNREGLSVNHLVPSLVNQWIQTQKLYPPKLETKKTPNTEEWVQFCVESLQDKKAEKIKNFDLRAASSIPFDFTIVVSGLNTRHTKMMAAYLQKQIRKKFFMNIEQIEGQEQGEWIVLDYGLFVIHIFYDYTREYYQLEDLWSGAPMQLYS